MNDIVQDFSRSSSNPGASAEETLRVVARLPVPAGVEQRVHARLKGAPHGARILQWPASGVSGAGGWMRGAAAAAIVMVVAGGGWGVYSRVQAPQSAKELAMPVRSGPPSGFSSAGAMRTPATLAAPLLQHVQKPEQAVAKKPAVPARVARGVRRAAKPAHRAATQP